MVSPLNCWRSAYVLSAEITPSRGLIILNPISRKKYFAKKCEHKSCRDALPPKKALPQKPMKQATIHTAMHAHTTYTSIVIHLLCSYHPYIFPTTPTTIRTTFPYSSSPLITTPCLHPTTALISQSLRTFSLPQRSYLRVVYPVFLRGTMLQDSLHRIHP